MAGKVGRPRHEPNDVTRKVVANASVAGLNHKLIGKIIGIDDDTLRLYYGPELETAKASKKVRAVEILWDKIEKGETSCLIFYMKTQMGWSDKQTVELTGANGGAIQTENRLDMSALTDEQLRAIATIQPTIQ